MFPHRFRWSLPLVSPHSSLRPRPTQGPARTSTPSRSAIGGRQRPSTIPLNFWPMEPMEPWWQVESWRDSSIWRLSPPGKSSFFLGDFQWICLTTQEGDHWLITKATWILEFVFFFWGVLRVTPKRCTFISLHAIIWWFALTIEPIEQLGVCAFGSKDTAQSRSKTQLDILEQEYCKKSETTKVDHKVSVERSTWVWVVYPTNYDHLRT